MDKTGQGLQRTSQSGVMFPRGNSEIDPRFSRKQPTIASYISKD